MITKTHDEIIKQHSGKKGVTRVLVNQTILPMAWDLIKILFCYFV